MISCKWCLRRWPSELEEAALIQPALIGKGTTVAELAEVAFLASERVKMLGIMNTPQDYELRKKAFIELAEARATAVHAQNALDEAIGK